MARSTNNNVVSGLRGMVGKLVFRTVRGRTIVSSRPCPPQYQSKRQREHRIRFRQAAKRARAALLDPNTKKHYTFKARKLNLPNAYTAALTDFMRKPSLDTVCYKPNHGDLFITATKKDFAISAVEVAITNTQGVPLITTAAEKDQHKHQWKARLPIDLWKHMNAEPTSCCQVTVTAKDYTGEIARKVIAVSELISKQEMPDLTRSPEHPFG